MTQPSEHFEDLNARDWIEEAIDQYQCGLEKMQTWRTLNAPGTHVEVILYKAAANHMQAAGAAAAIAYAKLSYDTTDG